MTIYIEQLLDVYFVHDDLYLTERTVFANAFPLSPSPPPFPPRPRLTGSKMKEAIRVYKVRAKIGAVVAAATFLCLHASFRVLEDGNTALYRALVPREGVQDWFALEREKVRIDTAPLIFATDSALQSYIAQEGLTRLSPADELAFLTEAPMEVVAYLTTQIGAWCAGARSGLSPDGVHLHGSVEKLRTNTLYQQISLENLHLLVQAIFVAGRNQCIGFH